MGNTGGNASEGAVAGTETAPSFRDRFKRASSKGSSRAQRRKNKAALRVVVEESKGQSNKPEVELKIPRYQDHNRSVVFDSKEDDLIAVPQALSWIPPQNARRDIRQYFKFLRQLGKGVSGSVYEVVALSNGKKYAMKQISRSNQWGDMLFMSECKFLAKLKHDGIVRLVDSYVDDSCFYILTELGFIDLFHRVKEMHMMPECQARRVVLKLLETLIFMHDCNICHRDLKPENVVFVRDTPMQPKLIDFGDALVVRSSSVYTEFVGTHCYLAPERLRQHRGWELKRSDVWTIGVIAYEIVTGKRCFYGKTPNCMFEKIKSGKWRFPKNFKVSNRCADFIQSLLQPDATQRPSARHALQHQWLLETTSLPKQLSACSSHSRTSATATRSGTLGSPLGTRRTSISHSMTVSDMISPQSVFAMLASNVRSTKLKNLLVKHEIARMSEEDYEFVHQAFNNLDRNNDGFVDASDLMESFVAEGLSVNEAAALARTVISELDMSGRGRIDIHAFAASHVGHELSVNERVSRRLFNEIDSAHCGFVSSQNLTSEVSQSELFHISEIVEVLRDTELSHDGRLSFRDFRCALKSPDLTEIHVSAERATSPSVIAEDKEEEDIRTPAG